MANRDVDPHRLYALSEDELAAYQAERAEERAARDRAVQAQIDAAKDPHLAEKLETIGVLYRQPDTMALWGIPRALCTGQSPRSVERARMESNDRMHMTGVHPDLRPKYQNPHAGWIWLGSPGWWGPYPDGSSERGALEAFLAKHKDIIPNGPCEWSPVEATATT